MGLRKIKRNIKKKVSPNGKPSVMIGRPIARTPEWENEVKVLEGFNDLANRGYKLRISDLVSMGWHGRTVCGARNAIVEDFIERGDDYLFFIDDDMSMISMATDIEKMIALDKDIVVANYVTKGRPHYPMMGKITKIGEKKIFTDSDSVRITDWPDEPYPVDVAGTGYMLIKKGLFEKMKAPYFYMPPNYTTKDINGEDTTFCFNAKMHGFEIWCDPSIRLGHIGSYTYELEERSTCFADFKEDMKKSSDEDFSHNLIPEVQEQFKKAEGPGVLYA